MRVAVLVVAMLPALGCGGRTALETGGFDAESMSRSSSAGDAFVPVPGPDWDMTGIDCQGAGRDVGPGCSTAPFRNVAPGELPTQLGSAPGCAFTSCSGGGDTTCVTCWCGEDLAWTCLPGNEWPPGPPPKQDP